MPRKPRVRKEEFVPSVPENHREMDVNEFDAYLLRRANSFSCCIYWGRGKYDSVLLPSVEEAIETAERWKKALAEVNVNPMIYGVVVGPTGPERSIYCGALHNDGWRWAIDVSSHRRK